ncbi:hypothetical protein [Thioalkalivibrio sp. ALMg9]|uniref:phage major tropism determinant n=1 Tax=Thioalkalivibrio sp. ALMg9 TaxID=1266912 RepID=UPI00037B56EF|nr:hypothetical protein [Thioalkalivibrio sp. ALMg9]
MISIEAAKMPGFASLLGRVKAAGDFTLDIPDMALNIGGHGQGFIVHEALDWDPTANEDGTLGGSLSLGDDVYLYAVADPSGVATLVASKNITVPDGHTAETTRRIGGFHVGRHRPLAERYSTTFNPPTVIVPNSVWDHHHRPTCDPTGMVEVIPDQLWADIYLSSEDGGLWPSTIPLSRHGATPLSGSEGYSRYLDLPYLAANAGKRLPTLAEFFRYADGAPQGGENDNDTAWSSSSNSGRTATGTVAKAVSCLGVVDAAGNLWEPTLDHNDVGSMSSVDYEWDRLILENGRDSTENRGEMYHRRWRFWMAGGRFDNGARCGSRCADSHNGPGAVPSLTGLRCVAPARRQ